MLDPTESQLIHSSWLSLLSLSSIARGVHRYTTYCLLNSTDLISSVRTMSPITDNATSQSSADKESIMVRMLPMSNSRLERGSSLSFVAL